MRAHHSRASGVCRAQYGQQSGRDGDDNIQVGISNFPIKGRSGGKRASLLFYSFNGRAGERGSFKLYHPTNIFFSFFFFFPDLYTQCLDYLFEPRLLLRARIFGGRKE